MATITAKELALRFDTDPRTVRKFIRSKDGLDTKVGKGQRWAIEAKQVKSLQKRFDAWIAAKGSNAANDATDAVEDEVLDEVEATETE